MPEKIGINYTNQIDINAFMHQRVANGASDACFYSSFRL